jgi:hypothetical protein
MPEKRKVSLPVGKSKKKKLQGILLLLRVRGEGDNTRRELVPKLCQLQTLHYFSSGQRKTTIIIIFLIIIKILII